MNMGFDNIADLSLAQATAREKLQKSGAANSAANGAAQIGKPDTAGRKVDEAAKDFESVFLSQMLQPMFEGVQTDEYFGGGHGEDMFRSLMIGEYGKIMSQAGGVGMADAVRTEMIKLQEKAQNGGVE